MRYRTFLAGVAVILALLPGIRLCGGDFVIRVHLINSRTGKPIPRKQVEVVRVLPVRRPAPGTISAQPFRWRQKTDAEGVAVFQLPGPPTGVGLQIYMANGGNLWLQCSNPGFWAQEIVDRGVVPQLRCPPWTHVQPLHFHAQPGNVYYFAVHITFWQHLKHCGVPGGCS
jgi:hypothetical protein